MSDRTHFVVVDTTAYGPYTERRAHRRKARWTDTEDADCHVLPADHVHESDEIQLADATDDVAEAASGPCLTLHLLDLDLPEPEMERTDEQVKIESAIADTLRDLGYDSGEIRSRIHDTEVPEDTKHHHTETDDDSTTPSRKGSNDTTGPSTTEETTTNDAETDDNLPEPIEVNYEATLTFDRETVDELGLSPQRAREQLIDIVSREPVTAGETQVCRTLDGSTPDSD